MEKKMVSIVIPIYNDSKYINKCVDSIIEQTYKNIEIILINDGSSDDSLSLIKKSYSKNKNIKIINQENIGVSETRNKGIKIATGKYIMFVDNDDYIDQQYVNTFLKKIEDSSADIVIGGFRRVNQNGETLYSETFNKVEKWSKYKIVTPWAKIYKREFLCKNNIHFLDYKIGEDVYFNMLLYSYNPKIDFINYVGYNWLDNGDSISNTIHKGFNEVIDIEYFLNQLDNINFSIDIYSKYFIVKFTTWYLLYSGKYSNSNKFIKESAKINSWFCCNKEYQLCMFDVFKIKGEILKQRIIIFIFLLLQKVHLIKLFSIFYCKGDK